MTVKGTLRWSWVVAVVLGSLVGGNFTGQAFAQGSGRLHAGGDNFTGQALGHGFQVIVSTIGDYDCFGYPALVGTGTGTSPCGTLPGLPIPGDEDPANTDIDLDSCTESTSVTFTHNFIDMIPPGATILGALWIMNIGGVETAVFPTTVQLDSLPFGVPNTGTFGTTLLIKPLVGGLTTLLTDGQLVVKVTHGVNVRTPKCDDVFVDFSQLIIVVSVPPTT
jgi:hypothetical protein